MSESGQENILSSLERGIIWCLNWGDERQPRKEIAALREEYLALRRGEVLPTQTQSLLRQVRESQNLSFPKTLDELSPALREQPIRIGLIYGGATKIKQYVFESAKLADIRGASALLERINSLDLPTFFRGEEDPERFPQCADPSAETSNYCHDVRQWLGQHFPSLVNALIPELIIYSTGGNILALCPAALTDDLANAIEKRYATETLTANACAVGDRFRLLELRLGLLQDPIETTPWLEQFCQAIADPNENKRHLAEACFGKVGPSEADRQKHFEQRKSFNELAGKLAARFQERRNGNEPETADRPSRRYPPMFETHPYLQRGETDRRSALMRAAGLPDNPWFSEATARKRVVGQRAKREYVRELPSWYEKSKLTWQPGPVESWVQKFEQYLHAHPDLIAIYDREERLFDGERLREDCSGQEARSLSEIGQASTPKGFVGYIYADGNNMGGYIQQIQTPAGYRQFSDDVVRATEEAVYKALARHLQPCYCSRELPNGGETWVWVHPFEILTIGGDDVTLIVPADRALEIARTICMEFEAALLKRSDTYHARERYQPEAVHRYRGEALTGEENQSKLSMSAGVLLAAKDTPIYYAEQLSEQLLKAAKATAKSLKKRDYYGGTIDFLVMKSVTMLSSSIKDFRERGLHKGNLKLYAAPYTLHEIEGLLATAKAIKAASFPRSQLYQIRSLLDRGKKTAILNYRYFWSRLQPQQRELLANALDLAWCQPKDPDNDGNLAPWMSLRHSTNDNTVYETIWRELVDLYPFIPSTDEAQTDEALTTQEVTA